MDIAADNADSTGSKSSPDGQKQSKMPSLNSMFSFGSKSGDNENADGESDSNSRAIGEKITSNLGKYCILLTGVFALGATANFGRAYLMLTAS